MRLGLSSDAAPDASVVDLVTTCERRGLSALELTLGTAVEPVRLLRHIESARYDTVHLAGLLSDASSNAEYLAAVSRQAGTPIIVRGSGDLHSRLTFTCSIVERGGRALLLVDGAADVWLDPVTAAGLGFAWQVDETCADPAGDVEQILRRAGRLEYVRLLGGGPETALQDGRGIGALMKCLALTGYGGPLILTPSSSRYRLAWSTWLGRRGGSGCGSKMDSGERAMIPILT